MSSGRAPSESDEVAPSTCADNLPNSYYFGEGLDWSSPLHETYLYVELPFWLMMPVGQFEIVWGEATIAVELLDLQSEVFVGTFMDSRATCVYFGAPRQNGYPISSEVAADIERTHAPMMERKCKSVLRLKTRAHESAFQRPDRQGSPLHRELSAYWESLCDAHIPVVNEIIQRYRLLTYDYFPYEVSSWDVPVWYLKQNAALRRAVLVPYKTWDVKPSVQSGEPGELAVASIEWTTIDDIVAASSRDATAGELDLLDARSLMERGDYTGAVRRLVTAIEAVVGWALFEQLKDLYGEVDATARLEKSANDFPGRLRQWIKIARPSISESELENFEETRKIRHGIVHRGDRLTYADRGRAQRAIDTGTWLYNKIEGKPDRAKLRGANVLKSIGRAALAPRFPVSADANGITVTMRS